MQIGTGVYNGNIFAYGREYSYAGANSSGTDRLYHKKAIIAPDLTRKVLRGQVKGMSYTANIDFNEIIHLREILPKMRMNPADGYYRAMQSDMQNSLNAAKQSRGNYSFDDLIGVRMEAYAKQYDALQKAYAEGPLDAYVSDGADENGRLQYHKATKEEDLAYLNEAFKRVADDMIFSVKSREIQWRINETFNGKEAFPFSLPDGYEEKLSGILKRAAAAYGEQKDRATDAVSLAWQYLNEDAEFVDAMRRLFSNIEI